MPPTTLTAPITKNATIATLDSWNLQLARNGSNAVVADSSFLSATLKLRLADGTEIETRSFSRDLASMPAGLRTAVRTFNDALISALRTANILPAGSDAQDI